MKTLFDLDKEEELNKAIAIGILMLASTIGSENIEKITWRETSKDRFDDIHIYSGLNLKSKPDTKYPNITLDFEFIVLKDSDEDYHYAVRLTIGHDTSSPGALSDMLFGGTKEDPLAKIKEYNTTYSKILFEIKMNKNVFLNSSEKKMLLFSILSQTNEAIKKEKSKYEDETDKKMMETLNEFLPPADFNLDKEINDCITPEVKDEINKVKENFKNAKELS